MFNEFWRDAEVISVYTDKNAQSDGILIDVSDLEVYFNGKIINRLTIGAALCTGIKNLPKEFAKSNLEFIAENSVKDREGETAWGIFPGSEWFENEKLWLVSNEIEGFTLMKPDEY
jgi:hypothetical protein